MCRNIKTLFNFAPPAYYHCPLIVDASGRRLAKRYDSLSLRQLRTLDALRGLAGSRGLAVLYVHAPPDVAYRFYRRREVNDASYTDKRSGEIVPRTELLLEIPGLRDKVRCELPRDGAVTDADLER